MTPAQPLFSIVVPTWNRGALIGETLASLLGQDFPTTDYEILVVDDGSTDDTAERLAPFLSRIQLLRQSKSGIAAARNLGLRHARGRYLVPFDSDDILFPFALGVYQKVIESFGVPPVIISSSCGFLTGQTHALHPSPPTEIKCIKCRDYFGKAIQTGASNVTFVLRREDVLATGGYGQDIYEDNDLICRLGTAGPLIKMLSPITVAVRHHDQNTTRNLESIGRGLLGLYRNERNGVYPGGRRRMLDRRGLLGLETLSCIRYAYLPSRNGPLPRRLRHIVRILAHARGMILAAPMRKALNWLYPKEHRLLAYEPEPTGRGARGLSDTPKLPRNARCDSKTVAPPRCPALRNAACPMASSDLLFSVVVPTWNRGERIAETIRSLLNQDYPASDFEVIVVDDGSTDKTPEFLERLSERIRVFRQPNSGAASARNLGIANARGEYLVSFDHDDLLLPFALRVYKRVIDEYHYPPVVLAEPRWFHGEGAPSFPSDAPAQIRCVKCRDFIAKNVRTPMTNSILVLRTEEVRRVGAYTIESGSADDDILVFKLGTASPMIKITAPVTVAHRIHATNARKNVDLIALGLANHIRNERAGVYPGGWRRRFNRRGLIGGDSLSVTWHYILRNPSLPGGAKLAHAIRVVRQARGMMVAGLLRKGISRFYRNEPRVLDLPAPG